MAGLSGRTGRGLMALLVVVVVIGGLAVGARQLWRATTLGGKSDGCDFGAYNLELSRAENAATMVSVVIKRNLPERAAVLTLGAALQESKLDNLPSGDGDRDSVGVLQQRPSQGWGTSTQLSDVHYATGKFLDALVKVPNWQTDDLADVIQKVQISADGSAYAKHEPQAKALADALMGNTAAGISCSFAKPTQVAAAAKVAAQLEADLPVNTPTITDTSIAVDGASWATAAWFVTHADRYGIETVRYAQREWTRSKGWHDQSGASTTTVSASLAAG
ncbi:MAG: hypothetical protein JWN95_1587 [Frankiales bacterium]|nr:hypothetical protein [Frankiales bacterium]